MRTYIRLILEKQTRLFYRQLQCYYEDAKLSFIQYAAFRP